MKNLFSKPVILACVCAWITFSIHAQTEGDGYGATSGGNGGTAVTVTNATDLRTYAESNSAYVVTISGTINLGTDGRVDLGSNTTLQGANTSSTLIGSILIEGVSNVIVKYLNISANTGDPGDNDGISVRGGAQNILITKCSVYDCTDGNIDITHGGGNTTVSWCHFYYTNNNGHNFSNLIGASDNDPGDYRTTWHHNWWGAGCQQRMTATRYGPCHFYNNYFNCTGNDYCTTSRNVGEVRSENNYYDNVEDPLAKEQSGILYTSGNIFNNCTGSQSTSTDNVFTPPYSYSLESAANVPTSVVAGAGNTGNPGTASTYYQLQNRGTGLFLDGMGRTVSGEACGQWGSTLHYNSQWLLVSHGGGYYQLQNRATGMFVDGYGSTTNGADVVLWANTPHYNSHWSLQQYDGNYYQLQNRSTGLFLDGMGRTTNGENCGQWASTTHVNSQWLLISISASSARMANTLTDEVAEEQRGADALFSPNPVKDILTIQRNGDEAPADVRIMNAAGQLSLLRNLEGSDHQIDVSHLPTGVYLLEVLTNQGRRIGKMIKE